MYCNPNLFFSKSKIFDTKYVKQWFCIYLKILFPFYCHLTYGVILSDIISTLLCGCLIDDFRIFSEMSIEYIWLEEKFTVFKILCYLEKKSKLSLCHLLHFIMMAFLNTTFNFLLHYRCLLKILNIIFFESWMPKTSLKRVYFQYLRNIRCLQKLSVSVYTVYIQSPRFSKIIYPRNWEFSNIWYLRVK